MNKVSIRFFNDREVRAVWDDKNAKWWFSVLDVIGVLRDSGSYEKNRNYWKYLKAKLKRENNQLGSDTTQFKLLRAGVESRRAKAQRLCVAGICRRERPGLVLVRDNLAFNLQGDEQQL